MIRGTRRPGGAGRSTGRIKGGVMSIPALSFTRPWPDLVLYCGKDIENRTWSTSYRGPLLVHAAKSWDGSAIDYAEDVEVELDRNLIPSDHGSWHAADHPTGIVGLVDLMDVCGATVRSGGCGCGPWAADGQYHWRLANPRPLVEPVPCNGALGLWRPDAVVLAALAEHYFLTPDRAL